MGCFKTSTKTSSIGAAMCVESLSTCQGMCKHQPDRMQLKGKVGYGCDIELHKSQSVFFLNMY